MEKWLHLNNLYLRYLFNRDIWRIFQGQIIGWEKEYEQLNNIKMKQHYNN